MSDTTPKLPPNYLYATHVPKRNQVWKYHTNIGHAKNAITGSDSNQNMQVWQVVDGHLKLLWNIPAGMKRTEYPWNNTPEAQAKREEKRIFSVQSRYKRCKVDLERSQEEFAKAEAAMKQEGLL